MAILLMASVAWADTDDYKVLNWSQQAQGIGYGAMILSVNADVQNQDTPGTINVTISCSDKDGLELRTFTLSGEFAANETRTMTKSFDLNIKEYDACKKWSIKKKN